MALDLVTAADIDTEPVTLHEAKDHLRVDLGNDDTLITEMITAARQWGEQITRRALMTQTWDWKCDWFPPDRVPIVLSLPPLQSVTSVTYIDTDGASQTWAASNYTVDAPSGDTPAKGRIIPNFEVNYPETQRIQNAVTIRFIAGYGDAAADVPRALRNAMLTHLTQLYDLRSPVVVGSINSQLHTGNLSWQYNPFVVPVDYT